MHVSWVAPPYERACRIADVPLPVKQPGAVVIIDALSTDRVDLNEIDGVIRRVRRREDVAVALRVPSTESQGVLRLAMAAHPLGIRAVVARDEPLGPALWDSLVNLVDLPRDLLCWLQERRLVPADLVSTVTQIVQAAPESNVFAEIIESVGVRPRTLRQRFERALLPAPSRWYQLGRLLDAQLRLLRDPELRVATLASELGYADRMSFTNRVYRLFGVTAEKSRRLLGWEWRFAEWWERQHLSRRNCAAEGFDEDAPSS